jgi:hypothetical protein
MNEKTLKIVGWVATGVGVVASMAGSYISGKQQENMISQKVAEEVSKQLNK